MAIYTVGFQCYGLTLALLSSMRQTSVATSKYDSLAPLSAKLRTFVFIHHWRVQIKGVQFQARSLATHVTSEL